MRLFCKILAAFVCICTCSSCNYSTTSGLPKHIKTVSVPTFRNKKTMYKGLESKLSKRIRELVAQDPQVRLVNTGGDATISGEIIKAEKQVYRETKNDRPASVVFTITVRFNFYDEIEQVTIIAEEEVPSTYGSSTSGLYEKDRGEVRADAEDGAIDNIARTIVRKSLGKW